MKAVIATLSVLALSSVALAEEGSPIWKTVDTWSIAVDTSLSNSCFMLTSYVDNTFLRLGLDKTNRQLPGYIIIGGRTRSVQNPALRSNGP